MGQIYGFQCAVCGYEVRVSGGPDAGMTCLTQTALCDVCCQLFDVQVSDTPWDQPSKKPVRESWRPDFALGLNDKEAVPNQQFPEPGQPAE